MGEKSLTLKEVNDLSPEAFTERYGGIAEYSAWVAQAAGAERPFADRPAMIEAFTRAVEWASSEQQHGLLRAHPDLAGKAAVKGALTSDSLAEQSSAGLNELTEVEFEVFTSLNGQYMSKFGFPFILAVKGATKAIIIDAFQVRLNNDEKTEFHEALRQVQKIIGFRLEEQVDV